MRSDYRSGTPSKLSCKLQARRAVYGLLDPAPTSAQQRRTIRNARVSTSRCSVGPQSRQMTWARAAALGRPSGMTRERDRGVSGVDASGRRDMQHNSGFQHTVGHADTVEASQVSFISSKSSQRRRHVSSSLALGSATFRGGNPGFEQIIQHGAELFSWVPCRPSPSTPHIHMRGQ